MTRIEGSSRVEIIGNKSNKVLMISKVILRLVLVKVVPKQSIQI